MEGVQALHMNGGDGETSYANNSLFQREVISTVRPVLKEAITALYLSISPSPSTIAIADLGCSSGSNTFFAASELIMTIDNLHQRTGHQEPLEYQVFLNDLPGNDFNALFRALPTSQLENHGRCFFNGLPGSFYGRLFPKESLHFVHSSYSLHWLSQVPEGLEGNKGKIYISTTSPQSVIDAYYQQFQNNFSAFLKHRAHELVPGGRMVLTFSGRKREDPASAECFCGWEFLAMALNELVSEGSIEDGKLDTFNVPIYLPSKSEVEAVVLKEGSFSISHLGVLEKNWRGKHKKTECGHQSSKGDYRAAAYGAAKTMRAVTEPMLVSHFGQGIIEDVFRRYRLLVEDWMAKEETTVYSVTVSLTRKTPLGNKGELEHLMNPESSDTDTT